ncbi:hypothetical protein C1J05_00440 [Sulfitobacter sp. JL08]|uniref:mechanosensitive ion channel family protein n=1 Tax=Sulfitobacter sp. JL08 TaxID=2070369 RepID=UPI000E0BD047|nr:mechanosensitive ion channel domain-containing protein [Sulfitobacter sp. JL08]AXI53172.1 hypothetical protein C1J05_00440 [Sulfitobacter sp. JL08]
MEFDLQSQPEIVQQVAGYALQGWELAQGWLLSPAAWSQFGLLIAAFLLAVLAVRRLRPAITRFLTPPEGQTSIIAATRRFFLGFVPLLLPVLAYVFTAIGESVVVSLFDSGAVIAFGKRVFLFLAARILVREVIRDPFLKVLGKYVLLPVAALHAVGLLDEVIGGLSAMNVQLGNISLSLMALVRGLIAGSLLFWLGRWSNDQSAALISQQEELRPATRQLAVKAAEIAIFGLAFILLMNIMGISLTSLAVLGGAIGVGLGFGLQKIAANFISGVILLLEGQATVGDYVALDDGPNKYTSDVLFLILNALKDTNIEIPFPQRVVELKGEVRTKSV